MAIVSGYTAAHLGAICFLDFKIQCSAFNKKLHRLDSFPECLLPCFLPSPDVINSVQYGNHPVGQTAIGLHPVMNSCVTDVDPKRSVKNPASVPVAALKRSLFNSKTSF